MWVSVGVCGCSTIFELTRSYESAENGLKSCRDIDVLNVEDNEIRGCFTTMKQIEHLVEW